MSDFRWCAKIWYRTANGLIDVEHLFDELNMLHDLVEAGPSWQAVENIEVIYTGLKEKLTIEEAEALWPTPTPTPPAAWLRGGVDSRSLHSVWYPVTSRYYGTTRKTAEVSQIKNKLFQAKKLLQPSSWLYQSPKASDITTNKEGKAPP